MQHIQYSSSVDELNNVQPYLVFAYAYERKTVPDSFKSWSLEMLYSGVVHVVEQYSANKRKKKCSGKEYVEGEMVGQNG